MTQPLLFSKSPWAFQSRKNHLLASILVAGHRLSPVPASLCHQTAYLVGLCSGPHLYRGIGAHELKAVAEQGKWSLEGSGTWSEVTPLEAVDLGHL